MLMSNSMRAWIILAACVVLLQGWQGVQVHGDKDANGKDIYTSADGENVTPVGNTGARHGRQLLYVVDEVLEDDGISDIQKKGFEEDDIQDDPENSEIDLEEEEEEEEIEQEEEEEEEEEGDLEVVDDDNGDDDDEGAHDEEYSAKESLRREISTSDIFSKKMQESLKLFRNRKDLDTSSSKSTTRKHKGQQTVRRFVSPTKTSREWKEGSGEISEKGAHDHQARLIDVLILTVAMAFSAGIGALPFFAVKRLSPELNGIATAVACGVMFAASFDLIHEGQPYGALMVLFGLSLGTIFIGIVKNVLDGVGDVQFGHLRGTKAKRMVLIVGIMAAHAIGEGCGVGVSFVGDKGFSQGILTTVAIGVHNIPEGMAKATVLVSQGASAPEALFWSILTCLPQPLMAIPSYLFVHTFESLMPVALGFAAGCMIWMVFAELLPEALKDCKASHLASAATFAAAALEGFRMFMEYLENSGQVSNLASVAFDGYRTSYQIGSWFRVCLLLAAIISSLAMHLMTVPIPVVLGLVSVVMGCIGILPISRDLIYAHQNIPRIHICSAVAVGAIGIVLLRNYVLERGNYLASTQDSGTMLNGSQSKSSPKKSKALLTNPVPLKSRAPLRALACILCVTSVCHAAVSGAQIQRDAKGASASVAAVYGYIFGIVSACCSLVWSLGHPSALPSIILATLVSIGFLISMKAASFNGTFLEPYPVGSLDSMSYIVHGAISMSSFLTLAVGMSMNARYCRFGIFVASLCLLVGFGAAFGLCMAGISSTCSVDSILVF